MFNQRKNLRLVHRELPQFQHILSTDHAVHSSFPSGDMSGATTFALVCFALTPEVRPWPARPRTRCHRDTNVLAEIAGAAPIRGRFSRVARSK